MINLPFRPTCTHRAFAKRENSKGHREIWVFFGFWGTRVLFCHCPEKKTRRLTSAGMFSDCFSFLTLCGVRHSTIFGTRQNPQKQDGEKGGQQPQREQMTYWSRLLPYSQHLPINKWRKKLRCPIYPRQLMGTPLKVTLG